MAVWSTSAFADVVNLTATMNGSQEAPAQTIKVMTASGAFKGSVTTTAKGYRLSWRLTFAGLSGKATFALIDKGDVHQHGPLVISLCGPCRSGAHGVAYMSPGEMYLAGRGDLYVNVYTEKNPSGEIRGQLK